MGNTSHHTRADVSAAIELLAETFPQTFSVYEARRKPLKIGIYQDAIARLDGAMTPREIGLALHFYCCNLGYLRSLRDGAARIDLDGNAAGVVSKQEAQQAAQELTRRKTRALSQKPPAMEAAQ